MTPKNTVSHRSPGWVSGVFLFCLLSPVWIDGAVDDGCLDCHSDPELTLERHGRTISLRVDPAEFAHTPHHDLACTDCHQGLNPDAFPHARPIPRVDCVGCHRDDSKVAGRTLHGSPFINAYENSIHGQALLAGNPDAPSCADCHGSHAVERGWALDSPVNRRRVSATCAACHAEAAADFRHSAHGIALARGNRDAPVCTDCHGEHNILARDDPRAPVSARNLAQQVCGDCHGSVRLAERYGISPNTYNTFADSYHGLAGRAGAVEVANCASCHGHHRVLNSSDPLSLIHPDNLASTCGTCHPGANPRFAVGRVHVALDRSSEEPVLFWIATVYVWLIVVVIGAMVLHNLLDYFHKVRCKARAHWDKLPEVKGVVPHRLHLRMTVNERCQHGLLALSFILLVVTGFMLRYPEAWWVEAMRRLNDDLFEWRGLIHRGAGVAMVIGGIWHAAYLSFSTRGRQLLFDILPRRSDLSDAIGVIRFNLGWAPGKPLFGRFSYVEKTEYWAMIWGSILMTVTGFFLWFDDATMGLFTKLGFDIFRIVHFYEAILATLAVIVWHFYFVIFNPDVYPMNMAWLTGKLSEEEMRHEHPLELRRILEESPDQAEQGGPAKIVRAGSTKASGESPE